MRTRISATIALALLASGCGDNSSQPAPAKQISVRSEQQNALHNLSESNLKIALRRAIYDSGKKCNTLTDAGYVQEYGNLSMWTATCSTKQSFAIFVGPDGSIQVRDCREVEQLKLPACVITKRPKPDRPA
ncbi:hypothetical protein GCM10023264_18690 [Sphingomonas daechungensis]|uniref:Uncharacterized protein n=1 Tax=Sphingomonas daechungensis TaxID=1176646 RepID=A0ABX6T291_9SPHN|nr:hypothetical protein [Sphingomonas daechungensis]QNP43971.1 hypothetical protein H9L15_05040 [Sphingomonas daechungensis]